MAKLAIKGGTPEAAQLGDLVPRWPHRGKDAAEAVLRVLESRRWCRLSPDSMCDRLESNFARFQNARHAIAVANGTVALELALKTLGVTYGDEVVVPAVTFIATASAVTEVGGIPVFADVDPETGQISPDSMQTQLSPRTKAIIVVHYAGYPVDFDRILPSVKQHGLFLIEDCAHAHGSEWKGRRVGAIGDVGAFSFQESKPLAAGEGGIVLTNDDRFAERARLLHNIGRVVGKPGYVHYVLSPNCRLSELQAALLVANMADLEEQTRNKHETGMYLADRLRSVGGIEPLRRDPRITMRGYYFFSMRYDPKQFQGLNKEGFVEALAAEGVPCGVGYGMPLYRQPAFRRENLMSVLSPTLVADMPEYEKLHLTGAERFSAGEVNLPHPVLLGGRKAADLVVAAIEKVKANSAELLPS